MSISLAFRRIVFSLLCSVLGCLAPQAFAQATFVGGAVKTDNLEDKGVQTVDIANDAISSAAFFADQSVGSEEVIDGSIDTFRLGPARRMLPDVPFGPLEGYWKARHIGVDEDGIGTASIAAIGTASIAAGAVDAEAIEESAVTDIKVALLAVGELQLARNAIELEHLGTDGLMGDDGARTRVDKLIAAEAVASIGVNVKDDMMPSTASPADEGEYQRLTLREQTDYWAERIGLDPDAKGDADGNLQERVNAVDGFLGESADTTDESGFDTASVSAQQNYIAGLIGLDPDPAVGNRNGNLQQRVKAALDELGEAGDIATSATYNDDGTSLYAKANYWVISDDVIGLDPNQREANEADAVAGNLSVRTNWDIDEIGDDTVPLISDEDVGGDADSAYKAARSFHARDNYWARRLGLNPNARNSANDGSGSLQERLNWLKDEVGQRLDVIAGFVGTASYTNELPVATYRSSSLRSQSNYWADRVGLDPYAIPDINGNIQSQINHLINEADRLTRSIAMAAALRDVYVPAGGKGGASFTFADYHGEFGFAMSLASLVGPRSKFTLSLGATGDQEETTVRLGYDIAW